MFNNSMPSLSDIAAVTDGNRSGFGGDGWWAIIILFALFGWGGRGYGWGGGNSDGSIIPENFALQTDMASIERRIDGIDEHLCDGFLNATQNIAGNFAAVQQAITSGFDNTTQNIMSNGYETRLALNNLQAQQAQCCCDTRAAIAENTTQGLVNTNLLNSTLMQNRFDDEKSTMQVRFDMQQNECNTLQAIESVGDRIINYMNDQETQRLRDENQALRFAASQADQNQYLTNTLRPLPVPAYAASNPWGCNSPFGGCGCGSMA